MKIFYNRTKYHLKAQPMLSQICSLQRALGLDACVPCLVIVTYVLYTLIL